MDIHHTLSKLNSQNQQELEETLSNFAQHFGKQLLIKAITLAQGSQCSLIHLRYRCLHFRLAYEQIKGGSHP